MKKNREMKKKSRIIREEHGHVNRTDQKRIMKKYTEMGNNNRDDEERMDSET